MLLDVRFSKLLIRELWLKIEVLASLLVLHQEGAGEEGWGERVSSSSFLSSWLHFHFLVALANL